MDGHLDGSWPNPPASRGIPGASQRCARFFCPLGRAIRQGYTLAFLSYFCKYSEAPIAQSQAISRAVTTTLNATTPSAANGDVLPPKLKLWKRIDRRLTRGEILIKNEQFMRAMVATRCYSS